MPSAAEVRRLRAASARLGQLAQLQARRGVAALDLGRPDAARDALLEIVPAVVQQYGTASATVGANFYDTARRAAGAAGNFQALLIPPDTDAAREATRRLAGWLYTDTPTALLPGLDAVVDRLVQGAGRQTITAAADQEHVRYARVPTSTVVCDFCAMLAGRGFVYSSADAAGESWEYHNHDGCEVVPSWEQGTPALAGFDPEQYKAQYEDALEQGRLDTGALADSSRRAKYYNSEATNARARKVYHDRRVAGSNIPSAGYGYSNPRSMAAALLRGNQRTLPG